MRKYCLLYGVVIVFEILLILNFIYFPNLILLFALVLFLSLPVMFVLREKFLYIGLALITLLPPPSYKSPPILLAITNREILIVFLIFFADLTIFIFRGLYFLFMLVS